MLSGNQIGSLLGWFIWDHFQKANPQANKSDVYMIASTVSSKFLKSMAAKEGFKVRLCMLSQRDHSHITCASPRLHLPSPSSRTVKFEETLTGFKWMGNKARDLEAQRTLLIISLLAVASVTMLPSRRPVPIYTRKNRALLVRRGHRICCGLDHR